MAEAPHGQFALRPKGTDNCIHHRRTLELVCNSCKELACVNCVTSLHSGHFFLKLKDKVPEAKEDIKSFISNSENVELPSIQQAITSAKDTLEKDLAHLDDLEKNVTKQLDRLKRDLEVLTADIISSYRKLKTENTDIMTGYIKALETRQADYNRFLKECKKVLQRGSHIDIYDVKNEITDFKTLPGKPTLGTASFTPNKQPLDHLRKSLGILTIGQSKLQDRGQEEGLVGYYQIPSTQPAKPEAKDRTPEKPEYKILRNAKLITEIKLPCDISALCPDNDGQVYTCHWNNNKVSQLNNKGEMQKEIQYSVCINDVRVSPTTQHIWTCSEVDCSVMECVLSQAPVVRFKTGNKQPHSLCVTVDNCILIGMFNQITKYNTEGKILVATKPSPSGQSVVSYPNRITECSVTHNVAVADHDYEHVLVMDKNLEEIFCYRGDIPTKYQQKIKRRGETFFPWDARYDSVGNLVISDCRRRCVHLLSGGGDYLKLIYTGDTVVYSVGIDINNVLWAHTGDNKVKLLQYCNNV